jgi:hypothetical protein
LITVKRDGEMMKAYVLSAMRYSRGIVEDKRLNGNKELHDIMKKLKTVCDADPTGEYQRILEQPRGDGAVH